MPGVYAELGANVLNNEGEMLETAKYDLGFSELTEIWTKLLKV